MVAELAVGDSEERNREVIEPDAKLPGNLQDGDNLGQISPRNAPWRGTGAIRPPRLDLSSPRPWKRDRPPSDSSISTALPSPLSARGNMMPHTTGSAVSTPSESEQSAPFSPKCPGGCLNPSISRRVAAPFTRCPAMPPLPYTPRKINPASMSSSTAPMPSWPAQESSKEEASVGTEREAYVSNTDALRPDTSDKERADVDRRMERDTETQEGGDTETDSGVKAVSVADLIAKLQRSVAVLQQKFGVWDPQIWLDARKAIVESKKTDGLGMLVQSVRLTSEWALEKGDYRVQTRTRHSNGLVDLRHLLSNVKNTQWLARENLDVPDFLIEPDRSERTVAPPLIFTDRPALDVVAQLVNIHGKDRQILLVTELTDFDDAGDADLSRQKGMNPYCLPLRSDFSEYVTAAKLEMKGGSATMQQHLCAVQDPYFFHCPSVTVFRGGREDGFPFLDDPFTIDVCAGSMPRGRPPVQSVSSRDGPTTWYAYRNDHISLAERYNSIGLIGMQTLRIMGERQGNLPILVVTALGSECQHPRDAVISILKNWRRRFAPYFRSIYVCWGGPNKSDVVCDVDDAVNKNAYRISMLEGINVELAAQKFMPWHWDSRELRLSCARSKLEMVGRICKQVDKKNSTIRVPRRLTPPPMIVPPKLDSGVGVQFSVSSFNEQKRETSLNALAALKSLDEPPVSPSSRERSGIPELETDSDSDDEPPPSATHLGLSMDPEGARLSMAMLPSPMGSDRDANRASIASTFLSNGLLSPTRAQVRQNAMESARELILQDNISATMTGIVLAGGIRSLFGFSKSISSAGEETMHRANTDPAMRTQDSQVKRAQRRTITRLLAEDNVNREDIVLIKENSRKLKSSKLQPYEEESCVDPLPARDQSEDVASKRVEDVSRMTCPAALSAPPQEASALVSSEGREADTESTVGRKNLPLNERSQNCEGNAAPPKSATTPKSPASPRSPASPHSQATTKYSGRRRNSHQHPKSSTDDLSHPASSARPKRNSTGTVAHMMAKITGGLTGRDLDRAALLDQDPAAYHHHHLADIKHRLPANVSNIGQLLDPRTSADLMDGSHIPMPSKAHHFANGVERIFSDRRDWKHSIVAEQPKKEKGRFNSDSSAARHGGPSGPSPVQQDIRAKMRAELTKPRSPPSGPRNRRNSFHGNDNIVALDVAPDAVHTANGSSATWPAERGRRHSVGHSAPETPRGTSEKPKETPQAKGTPQKTPQAKAASHKTPQAKAASQQASKVQEASNVQDPPASRKPRKDAIDSFGDSSGEDCNAQPKEAESRRNSALKKDKGNENEEGQRESRRNSALKKEKSFHENEDGQEGEDGDGRKRFTKQKSVIICSSKVSVEEKLTVKQEADKLRAQLGMADKDSDQGSQSETMTPIEREGEVMSGLQAALDRFRQTHPTQDQPMDRTLSNGARQSLPARVLDMCSVASDEFYAPPEDTRKPSKRNRASHSGAAQSTTGKDWNKNASIERQVARAEGQYAGSGDIFQVKALRKKSDSS